MSALRPVAVYGLEVPAGDIIIPAVPDFPATFRITMAAIDPSAAAEVTTEGTPRATLKILHQPMGTDYDEDDDDYDEDDEDNLEALLNGLDSDEDSSEDEEANGGPSDPEKSKKARKEAALAQIKKALEEEEDEMDVDDAVNGLNGALEKARKGKARATGEEESSEEDEDADEDEDSEDGWALEEFVICTLDPEKNYQQPLDITVTEDERVFFKVSGTHKVYLTGNYVIPQDEDLDRHFYEAEDDEEDYDLSPDEDELDDFDEDDESDELDDLEDPRITEVDSDEEAPKLVKSQKGKNKRAAESDDEGADLDSIVAKSLKTEANADGEPKLSKKQLKKLKNNAGEAVSSATEGKSAKKDEKSAKDGSAGSKSDKKVQFAKNLEQGPTPAKEAKKDDAKKTDEQGTLGVKMVKGVKIDDKKLGKGPRAKNGDRVGMRYIGKFKDGKVFDSNKKGEPFKFKLGAGEVIKGWDIGVAGMAPGGERRIIIPSSLAYGSKPPPGIPSNAELTFDVKLLTINGH